MSNEENIDRIFSYIAENANMENLNDILNEEKISHAKNYLNIINSLNNLVVHISSMTVDILNDPKFLIDIEIYDMIEKIYLLSEDLTSMIIKKYYSITLEELEEIENLLDNENGENEEDDK